MRKVMALLGIIGISLFFVLPVANAAKESKPNKTECRVMDGGGVGYFDQSPILLGAKSSGVTGKDIDDKIKYYTLIGEVIEIDPVPFIGSMYYHHAGVLYGLIHGMTSGNPFSCTIWLWDEGAGTDSIFCSMYNGAPVSHYDLLEADCKDYDFDLSTSFAAGASSEAAGVSNPTTLSGQ